LTLGFFDRLREGLTRTKEQIVSRFEEIVQKADTAEQRTRPIDVDTIEALEELLISADVGIPATERIVNAVRGRARRGESLRDLVKQEIRNVFDTVEPPPTNGHQPHVTLIVGVNGTGKTTTIGKLANLLKASGKQPLVCAADTFRAAAVEQLEIWAKRAGVDFVPREGRVGSGSGRVRCDSIGQGARTRSNSRGYGRPSAHTRQPDERAGEDSPRRRTCR
jgi:fused signal recognition particle receptor